ncbi:helix-turn-helix domain-containing protein [Sphingomonas adhaesiva]|uniref:helix-turn-helix domain-containing protein n=1 Tax=Sphingomonas adhaesiva TaxID=28212 RepID=UPI002FF98E32
MDDPNDRARQARADSPFLTAKQAAHYLGIAPDTLKKMRRRGTAPVGRIHGRTWRYHIDDLDTWSRARRAGGGDA